jgi:membrane fusion protein, copper/silver efflux system
MTVKPRHLVIAVALVAAAGFGLFLALRSGSGEGAAREGTLYTCGMHPQVIQDHPGNCPICEMKLTPLKRSTGAYAAGSTAERRIKFYQSTMNPGEISQTPGKDSMGMDMVPVYENGAADGWATISIDPVTMQNMGIRTTEVTRGPLQRTVRTVGVIGYDETMIAEVTTKYKGWIEKLYVDATGKQVHRGEPLFEIYSPELYSAQMEYVLALGDSSLPDKPGRNGLLGSARQKLKFFDISDAQIDELEKTREPKKTLRVGAPIDGFVTEKTVVEGMMAEPGMKLYRLADLGIVWVYAQVYEQDLPYIRLGQEASVSLSYMPGRKFRGRVTYVYPNVDEKTRTVRVRMEFHNPGYFLKPGMFAAVQVSAQLDADALLVPDSAVLRSGEKDTVFVALEGGKFEPRTVTIGPRAEGDRYQVLSGLNEGERVVTSGQFMLDSESQLREAIQKMLNPTAPAAAGEAAPARPSATKVEPAAPATNAPPVYICPMPEHVAIEYSQPGKCPLCGMTLVPVSRELLARIQPGGTVESYTCPMPEHSDVRSDKPGKCPKCGMTLIPVMTRPKPPTPPANQTARPKPLTLYTCPMAAHADVVSDKPGKCPKCEMDLVETSKVKHGKIAEEIWRKQYPEALERDAPKPASVPAPPDGHERNPH